MQHPPTAYLSPSALAAYIGVSRSTVYRWLDEKFLPPPSRIGRGVRWRKDEIDTWMEMQKGADCE